MLLVTCQIIVMVRFDASIQTGKTKVTIRALCAPPKNKKNEVQDLEVVTVRYPAYYCVLG